MMTETKCRLCAIYDVEIGKLKDLRAKLDLVSIKIEDCYGDDLMVATFNYRDQKFDVSEWIDVLRGECGESHVKGWAEVPSEVVDEVSQKLKELTERI
tara:strand:- start:241 stop:534 length:294 start_codon:yes stop_codon:yes gene_type:complete